MPLLAKSQSGTVTALWGTAFLQLPDGTLKPIKVGDPLNWGEQILTSQDGIVQITRPDGQMAELRADALAPSDLDRDIAGLEDGEIDFATAAGLTGGGEGGLTPGLRVDRVSESVTPLNFAFETAGLGPGAPLGGVEQPFIADQVPAVTLPTLSVGNASTIEGGNAVFTVSLSAPSSTPQTYSLALSDGTATQGQDYANTLEVSFDNGGTWAAVLNGQVVLPAGQTGFLTRVPTLDDNVTEATETFTLTVSGAGTANGSAAGTGSIVDNDAPPVLDLDANDSSGTTGSGYQTSYAENGEPVRLADADVSITDADSTILKGATITLTNAQAGDVLSVLGTLPSGITAAVNGSIVTLTGDASLAAYQAALREIGFSSTSDNPSTTARSVEITVTDGGQISNTALTTIEVVGVNDAPTVTATSGTVSEEGLPGGATDPNAPSPESAVFSGKIDVSDPDGDVTTVTLTGPSGIYGSNGSEVIWTSDGNGGLIGAAGPTTVATLTIDAAGNYTFELQGALKHSAQGEDTLDLTFGVSASDGRGGTGTTSFTITVQDDMPATLLPVTDTVQVLDTNVLIVLDVSGSMNNQSGIGNLSSLQAAIQSINALLDSYDQFGNVSVRLVTFSDTVQALGTTWVSIAQAKTLLANISAIGSTNYDYGLSAAEDAFASDGKISGAQNVSYFFSDGDPTLSDTNPTGTAFGGNNDGNVTNPELGDGIDALEEAAWQAFLDANRITSYVVGLGASVNQSNLNPIAYDGQSSSDLDATVVTDLAQLGSVLAGTVKQTTSGSLSDGQLLGADGFGHIQSITVDGVEYTYDAATPVVSISTALGQLLTVNFDTGAYTYSVREAVGSSATENFSYTLVDKDGDLASSTLTIEVQRTVVAEGSASADTLTGQLADANVILGHAGDDTIIGGSVADQLFGNEGNDVLRGLGGDDFLHGGADNDTLVGGVGSDTLVGGLGSDVFRWSLGDGGTEVASRPVDTIKDFDVAAPAAGGDVLDLRDLLVGENAGNLSNYLNFDTTGSSTVIRVSTTGGFANGTYASGADHQQIVLEGVNLRSGLGLAADASGAQIIGKLIENGKLLVDNG